jgi:RNA polymerase subunit RPABC4/transcription elongation factor Spt4
MASSGEKTILLFVLIVIVLFILVTFGSALFYFFRFPMEINSGFILPHRILPVPLLFPLLLFILGIVIIFWVYRDAEQRGMNGVLWALLVLVGNIVGLIIYLIVRSEEFPQRTVSDSTQSCPSCGKMVIKTYAFCPHCGARLQAVCPSCDKSVSSDWKVCPYCGQKLTEQ